MTNTIDVAALAKLARLEVASDELARLGKEIPAIVAFVEAIQNAPVSNDVMPPALRNVMRADEGPHETGLYTKRIIDAAPASENNRIVVKQVISRKK